MTSEREPAEFWFPDEDGTESLPADYASADFVGLHEQVLGRPIEDLLLLDNTPWRADKLDDDLIDCLFHRSPSISLSMLGTIGDSGMGLHSGLLFANEPTRTRLVRDKSRFYKALRNRTLLKSTLDVVVNNTTQCMMTNCGIDNRSLLPPFSPLFRNQDKLFGQMVRLMHPGSLSAYLPMALEHIPQNRPSAHDPAWMIRHAAMMGVNDIIAILLGTLDMPREVQAPAARLSWIGNFLFGLGTLSTSRFTMSVRERVWAVLSGELARLDGLLTTWKDAPDFWVHLVMDLRQLLELRLTDPELIVSGEFRQAAMSSADAVRGLQQYITQFGELLLNWPEMYAAAGRGKAEHMNQYVIGIG